MNHIRTVHMEEAVMPELTSMDAVFSLKHKYWKKKYLKKVAQYPYYKNFRSEALEIKEVAFQKKACI